MRNEHQEYNSLGYASEWHMTDVSIQKGIYFAINKTCQYPMLIM